MHYLVILNMRSYEIYPDSSGHFQIPWSEMNCAWAKSISVVCNLHTQDHIQVDLCKKVAMTFSIFSSRIQWRCAIFCSRVNFTFIHVFICCGDRLFNLHLYDAFNLLPHLHSCHGHKKLLKSSQHGDLMRIRLTIRFCFINISLR